MKEISKKLRQKAIESSKPFIDQCVAEGMERNMIISAVKVQVQSKINNYYSKRAGLRRSGAGIRLVTDHLDGIKADSKAERIFYVLLHENTIPFEFQYNIGPYTVDFLLLDIGLVIEVDGPKHDKDADEIRDKYLREQGYKILRIPIWVLAHDPDAVISEIKAIIK